MKRRQVTYARRRRERARAPPERDSSPLQEIDDPEREIDHSEMSRRMLKRSRLSGCGAATTITTTVVASDSGFAEGRDMKKLRTSMHGGRERVLESLPLNQDLQTPHPTFLTESQKYQLESSRGLPLSPNKFSPVPLAQPQTNVFPAWCSGPGPTEAKPRQKIPLRRQTSSSNLKENANRPLSKPRSKSPFVGNDRTLADSQRFPKPKSKPVALELPLASPFTSSPASPYISPRVSPLDNPTNVRSRSNKIRAMKAKRTLSDTHYNPNLPTHVQEKVRAQTAVSSPTHTETEITKIRRPSAPSAVAHRPDVASWFVSSNILAAPKSKSDATEHDPSQDSNDRVFGVDFNRPPSQLSYTSSYDDNLFVDALGMSTPFGLKNLAAGQATLFRSGSDAMDYLDSGSEDEFEDGKVEPIFGPGLVTKSLLSEALKSLWQSDSLISPPTALLERAYSKSPEKPDVNAKIRNDVTEDSLGLGSPFGLGPSPKDADRETQREEDLKELFECLDISFGGCPPPNISRTRSLDQGGIPTLYSPAYISPTKAKNANISANARGGRDRRGTIRASDFQGKRPTETSTVEGGGGARRTRSGTIIGPARRDRSGTIIARPPNLVLPFHDNMDVDMQDVPSVPEDIHGDATTSESDEFEDEMLLKSYWHDEDWVVAENPSPVVPRRKNMKRQDSNWRKEWERNKIREKKQWKLGISTGNWGVSDHDEDDGEDDPLDSLK